MQELQGGVEASGGNEMNKAEMADHLATRTG